MAKTLKTPGVYIDESNAFPGVTVEVETAVPAFIGYTEKARNEEASLLNKPHRISSIADYQVHFGFGPSVRFSVSTSAAPNKPTDPVLTQDSTDYYLNGVSQRYHLYRSMFLFFQNGGGPCYVVSVGDYTTTPESSALIEGIKSLLVETEPTIFVCPDAVLLSDAVECAKVQQFSLAQCRKQQRCFSIVDVFDGYKDRTEEPDCISAFRTSIGSDNLSYGAAYYPWIETTIVQDSDLNVSNLNQSGRKTLVQLIKNEQNISHPPKDEKEQQLFELIERLEDLTTIEQDLPADLKQEARESLLHKSLLATSDVYTHIFNAIRDAFNLMPPSGAMAGVYTMVDNIHGVWKAPANVSLGAVISPAVNISHDDQEDLNVHSSGKSVNAIRSFVGEGTLVWGARTLDGNSLDWRYINVRRTMTMLEQSIRLTVKAYVFEANDAATWVSIKSMTRNFLTGIWKRGGLAGATPEDAFSVHVGLGETMTPEDILEGVLAITVLVAPTRPAEFIEITFRQQMQK